MATVNQVKKAVNSVPGRGNRLSKTWKLAGGKPGLQVLRGRWVHVTEPPGFT